MYYYRDNIYIGRFHKSNQVYCIFYSFISVIYVLQNKINNMTQFKRLYSLYMIYCGTLLFLKLSYQFEYITNFFINIF